MYLLYQTRARHNGYILVFAIVFLGIFFTMGAAYLGLITSSARDARFGVASAQALALAEAGIDKAAYQLNQDSSYAGETNTELGNGVFTVSVSNIDSVTKLLTATGYVPNSSNPAATKTVKVNIGISGDVVSFHYGIQAGNGGFSMSNSSSVTGNVYSNGSIVGSGGNNISGDVVSADPGGQVYGIHAGGSVHAHTIGTVGTNTTIDGDAYYVTKTNTTVNGTSYPGSPDMPTASPPISDEKIEEWEQLAAAGGTATCTDGSYTISSGEVNLGPIKIPCNLTISNSSIVTVGGHIWVTGNMTIQNSAQVKMAPSLGATNVAIIADNPTDQINSGTISVKNIATFQNSGTEGSFIFLISQNKSAENGGYATAIGLYNQSSAVVAYAAHGLIPLKNQISLKEVTAYKITLKNLANVTYDNGLANNVFESGPGGSWGFIPGTYAITR